MADSSGMHATPPSLVRALPSDSQEFSALFNQLLHSSPLGMDPNHSGSEDYAPKPNVGKPVASHFSDPNANAYIPPPQSHVVHHSDAIANTTSFEQHNIVSQENENNNLCDFTSPLENKNAEASELPSKPAPPPCTSSKRSRASEFHNLSEKRRRSRINEKMKALQNLIPNSNKTDKASMLDEAIEYLKQLQLQVQMLMMRNGLSLHPMYLPRTGLNFDEGNGFQNSTSGITSSVNAESLVRPAFSFPKHCSISNQSVVIPPVTNIATSDTSSSFQPSIKDALCVSMPQLLLDTTKIGKTPSPDVS